VVADYNGNGGLTIDEGIVQRVTLHGGKTKLYVNDMEYEYSNIMEIREAEKAEENSLTEMLGNILERVDNLNNTINSNISPTDEIQPNDEAPQTEETLPNDETQ
jgi:hypothetical protein